MMGWQDEQPKMMGWGCAGELPELHLNTTKAKYS
jgi:hypothetical protein